MSTQHTIALDRIGQHMAGLAQYREAIFQLQSVWDNLSLLAQLSGTGTDMTQTRLSFSQVTNDVLSDLSNEMMNKTVTALASKAYVIINVVIRNLFERTADIGFLATDDDIRLFLQGYLRDECTARDVDNMRVRFNEYVSKYSVYSNIILLDTNGNVLVQLDESNPLELTHDALVSEALNTSDTYIEVYRHVDLIPNEDKSLIYAYRVTSSDGKTPLGVLCLCFRFQNEMAGVFSDLIPANDWAIGIMLDQEGHVIASSDQYQIPLGAQLEITKPSEDWILTRFAGREYITVTRRATGYQGYTGPGWMGHAMVPLEHAFDQDIATIVNGIDAKLLAKVMRSPLLFSESLLGIPQKAAMIQSKLNQSVWNGNIWQTRDAGANQNNFSKILLWEISNTGFKTQNIIEKTVSELYQTVVSVMLENSRFFAFLAVDIMDRNLYERANDCRWWALTSSFRQILSKSNRSVSEINTLGKILSYINGLYTVYDNLVIFDRQGVVLAVSNPSYRDCVGTALDCEWLSRVRGIRNTQEYVVSKFEPTNLYQGKPTYIYAAAIRTEDNTAIVGGIGIVFDSEPQFKAILNDISPRDPNGKSIPGSFTLFVDGELKIISSTNKELPVGSDFKIVPSLCKLAPGKSAFDIAAYNDRYYAVGACASSGYREYKGKHDPYQNQMTALIFIPLGIASDIDALLEADKALQHNQFKPSSSSIAGKDTKEFATFYVGAHWLGLPATQVVEAIEPLNIRQIPDCPDILEGLYKYEDDVIPVMNLARLLGDCIDDSHGKQIIILQASPDSHQFGILVSALGEIPSIAETTIESLSNIFSNSVNNPAIGIAKVASSNGESNMLTILSAESLWMKISGYKMIAKSAKAVA